MTDETMGKGNEFLSGPRGLACDRFDLRLVTVVVEGKDTAGIGFFATARPGGLSEPGLPDLDDPHDDLGGIV